MKDKLKDWLGIRMTREEHFNAWCDLWEELYHRRLKDQIAEIIQDEDFFMIYDCVCDQLIAEWLCSDESESMYTSAGGCRDRNECL